MILNILICKWEFIIFKNFRVIFIFVVHIPYAFTFGWGLSLNFLIFWFFLNVVFLLLRNTSWRAWPRGLDLIKIWPIFDRKLYFLWLVLTFILLPLLLAQITHTLSNLRLPALRNTRNVSRPSFNSIRVRLLTRLVFHLLLLSQLDNCL